MKSTVSIIRFIIMGFVLTVLLFSFTKDIRKKEVVKVEVPTNHMQVAETTAYIKVALLLDTSNSMDGLIAQAKAQLWQIVNELSLAKYGSKHPHLNIALYEYGNDGLESSDGYIRQVLNFSSDLDLISEKLFGLKTNGGSEYCGQVIQKSLQDLSWGTSAMDLNLIFIAGNEPFTQGNVSFRDVAYQAQEKHVTVNTIYCGNYDEGIYGSWKEGALLTGGDYAAIDHNQVQVYIVTPYDAELLKLNEQLNATYIYYGMQGYHKIQAQMEQDKNANEMSESVAVERVVSKSKSVYNNASWDLIDASKTKDFDFNSIKRENLPKAYRDKSHAELKDLVYKQAQKRKEIQDQITSLQKKRSIFLATKTTPENRGGLEQSILQSIRKQAQSKQYQFE